MYSRDGQRGFYVFHRHTNTKLTQTTTSEMTRNQENVDRLGTLFTHYLATYFCFTDRKVKI